LCLVKKINILESKTLNNNSLSIRQADMSFTVPEFLSDMLAKKVREFTENSIYNKPSFPK
jgi:hypothetical protein